MKPESQKLINLIIEENGVQNNILPCAIRYAVVNLARIDNGKLTEKEGLKTFSDAICDWRFVGEAFYEGSLKRRNINFKEVMLHLASMHTETGNEA